MYFVLFCGTVAQITILYENFRNLFQLVCFFVKINIYNFAHKVFVCLLGISPLTIVGFDTVAGHAS